MKIHSPRPRYCSHSLFCDIMIAFPLSFFSPLSCYSSFFSPSPSLLPFSSRTPSPFLPPIILPFFLLLYFLLLLPLILLLLCPLSSSSFSSSSLFCYATSFSSFSSFSSSSSSSLSSSYFSQALPLLPSPSPLPLCLLHFSSLLSLPPIFPSFSSSISSFFVKL